MGAASHSPPHASVPLPCPCAAPACRPEFINRIDDFIIFEGLGLEQIRAIVRLQAQRVAERLRDKKMALELRDSAIDWLATQGWVRQATGVQRAACVVQQLMSHQRALILQRLMHLLQPTYSNLATYSDCRMGNVIPVGCRAP